MGRLRAGAGRDRVLAGTPQPPPRPPPLRSIRRGVEARAPVALVPGRVPEPFSRGWGHAVSRRYQFLEDLIGWRRWKGRVFDRGRAPRMDEGGVRMRVGRFRQRQGWS